MARRRTGMVGPGRLAALAAVAALLLTSCSGATTPEEPSSAPSAAAPATPTPTQVEGGWQRLPDPPLSPRSDALGVWVDAHVLVLGGSDATWAGGPYRPPELRDGAALDPSTRTWRPVATAPWPPAQAAAHAVVGHRLLLARNGRGPWLAYDSRADTWSRVPAPPVRVPQPTMAVRGHRVFVLDQYVEESPAPVQVLDLATGTWSALPASPYRPAIDGRTLVATDAGLVVMGEDLHPRQAGDDRQPALAEIWDGSRWRRVQSDHAAGTLWHWTGERVISTYRATHRESARGGLHEFRASAFDPAGRTWDRLPWLPGHRRGLLEEGWPQADGTRVLSQGYLYDDRTGASVPVREPSRWGSRTQVLTDDAVVLVGGQRPKPGQRLERVMRVDLTAEAWLLPTG